MADFTGMTVRLVMKEPPGFSVQGKVREVVAGSTLTLEDVTFLANGHRTPHFQVRGPDIADLQVVNTNAATTPTTATRTNAPPLPTPTANIQRQDSPIPLPPIPPVRTTNEQPQQQPSDFVDPAILSYGRSPVQTKTPSRPVEPSTPVKSMLSKAVESLPTNSSPFIGEAGKSSGSRKASQVKDTTQQAAGAKQSITLQTQNIAENGTQEAGQIDSKSKKKAKKPPKKKSGNGGQDPPPVMNAEVSRNGNDMDGSINRGKGWRQTPLLQPSPQTATSQDKTNSKKSRKQHEGKENGWATEEATDIQDMGDFDFEANNKMFDKKQFVDEMRQGDTTADEDRLVGHNRAHRPGTYGGKNLHPTENVLSPKIGPKHGSNELESTSDADTELNFPNGRSSSRHSASRISMKKQPSRQNSAALESKPHPLTASMSSDRGMNRSVTSLASKPGKAVHSVTASPLPDRTHSPQSAISTSKTQSSSLPLPQIAEPHLAIRRTMAPCPVLHPNALDMLEKETVSRFGLTHDAITESAARNIAEMAINMFDLSIGSRRGSRANTIRGSTSSNIPVDRNAQPVVVILAGNHALGARALAAARHLCCRKVKIIVAEAQYESVEARDPQLRTQIHITQRIFKSGADIKRGKWDRASGYIKRLPAPPTVIIDALLAGASYESLLRSPNAEFAAEAQREAREMIDWANRSRAPVLSVGCPSGVSGIDGSSPLVEGEPLAVRPDKVLSLGAPMQGLLEAMRSGERWDVSLADIGINITLRSEEAVPFDSQWMAELRYLEDEGLGIQT